MTKRRLIAFFAVTTALATSSYSQTLPTQQITANNVSEGWKNEGSPTSGGQILFYDTNQTVWLYNGTTTLSVQPTPGQTIDHVFMLGSGATAGNVIAGWRRGAGYADVSINGAAPVKVDLNPESVAIADGCIFFALQVSGTTQHAFKVDPVTGGTTQLSAGTGVQAGHIASGSGCKAAWAFSPSSTSPYGIQYWNGTTTTPLETDADLQYGTPMRRGQIVYVKQVGGISQVFVVDTNTSLTPVQLSAETDATKYLHPLTDGRHVAWYRCTLANCTDGQIIMNGGLQYPTGALGSIDSVSRLPFELDRGQILWKGAAGGFYYDDGRRTFELDPSTATTMQLPYLTDGYIAFLGQGGSDAGSDLEVFRITGTPPDETSQPSPPMLVVATPGTGQVTVAWDRILGATSYNLYVAQVPGVTKDNYASLAGGRKITGVTTPFVVSSMPKSEYFFAVTAVEGPTEGPSSRVATALVGLTWQAVGGLVATDVYSVAADQTNASLVYAGVGGSVYKSADGGINWASSIATGANRVAALAVNGAVVFANAMPQADIWKTINSGTAWTQILDVTGFGESAGSLAIDPVTPSTIYAADFILPTKTSAHSLVIKSTNGGTNWALTPQGPPGDEIHAYAMAIDPTNPSIIYAGGTGNPNLVKTINGTTSWTNIPIPGATGGVYSIAVDPTNSNTVYATTRDIGVFKSLNGGATWIAHNNGITVTSFVGYFSILIDPQNPSYLHLGAGNGYYYSLDGGLSWTAANAGLVGSGAQYIYALALTPARRLIAATGDGLFLLGIGQAPVITGVTPPSGPPAGGTNVTIAGSGFQPAATVTFGGTAATNVVVVNSTTMTATTPAHSAGAVAVVVTNFDTTSGTLANGFTYSTPGPPAAPTGVVATAQEPTTVMVSWNAAATATSYLVFRASPGVDFTQLGGSTTATSVSDTTATADTSYLYRVRAVNSSGSSADSAKDIATTVIFTDDPLVAGVVVKAIHLSQARTAINAVRLLAGLVPTTFTDTAAAGLIVKQIHVTQMRSSLDAALGPLGFTTGGYTNPSLTGVVIKAVHFQEIRNRMK